MLLCKRSRTRITKLYLIYFIFEIVLKCPTGWCLHFFDNRPHETLTKYEKKWSVKHWNIFLIYVLNEAKDIPRVRWKYSENCTFVITVMKLKVLKQKIILQKIIFRVENFQDVNLIFLKNKNKEYKINLNVFKFKYR